MRAQASLEALFGFFFLAAVFSLVVGVSTRSLAELYSKQGVFESDRLCRRLAASVSFSSGAPGFSETIVLSRGEYSGGNYSLFFVPDRSLLRVFGDRVSESGGCRFFAPALRDPGGGGGSFWVNGSVFRVVNRGGEVFVE